MKDHFCEQENAVLEAVESGRWPQGCDAELRSHVAQCEICADVVLVARILQQESQKARAEAPLPAAGLVWWKAQLRARHEAAARAAEPIAWVERAAAIFGVVSMIALTLWRWDLVTTWVDWLSDLPHSAPFHPGSLWNPGVFSVFQSFGLLIVLSASVCLLLTSLVLYFAFKEE
jgi:hypothetical protein